MTIQIDLPVEFDQHFMEDRFEDSLQRLSADAGFVAGNYEKELAAMLVKAFKECRIVEEKKNEERNVLVLQERKNAHCRH